MADETIIQTPSQEPDKTRSEERFTQLSEKVKEEATARVAAERRATFAEGFVDVLAVNPAAKEFKADIQAKVEAGLTVEDATYAVLGKAGKLGTPQTAQPNAGEIAGGSATSTPSQGGAQKPIGEMSLAEKRAALDKELLLN